jgi:MFS family permease
MQQKTDAPQAWERTGWGATFASLSYRNFRLLWVTTIFSAGGNWVQQVTLSWLAYDLTGSPVQVSLVLGARTIPMLTSPLSGALADRFDRKRLLVVDHLAMMVIALTFAVINLADLLVVWHMYVFAFLSGATWSMNNPVRQALVANSVPREMLTNAIAINSMAFNSMRMLGPAVGGGLIVIFGPGWNFMIQALMYVAVVISIIPYHAEYSTLKNTKRPPFFKGLGEGFRYIGSHNIALSTTILTLVPTFTMMAFITSQMAVFAAEDMGDPDGGTLGLLLAAMGLGGFIGTFFMARFATYPRKGRVALGAAFSAGVGFLILSQVTVLWLALIVLAIQQMFFMSLMMTSNSIIQSTTPDELRGRVMGVYMLDIGFQPFGGVFAGFIVAATSVSTAWMTGALAGLVGITLVAIFAKDFRRFTL